MKILINNSQSDLKVSLVLLRKLIRSTLQDILNIACDEISLHLVSRKKISELHDQFFDDPSITDCISFPIDLPEDSSDYKVLGEVFVCPYVATEYAKAHKKDPYEELSLYIVHGLLHLIGLDDIDRKDRKTMRKKEKFVLGKLKEKNLLLS